MTNVKNSEVINHVMDSFFHVISTKTSPAHAWLTLKIIMQEIEYDHDFIKSVDVVDIEDVKTYIKMSKRNEKEFNIVQVHTDVVDHTNEDLIGKAIQSLADKLKKYMGKKAGYHFLREFRDDLGEDYHSIIKKMGVDLRLIELQEDLYGWINENYVVEENNDSNIAFIMKK